MTDQAEHVAARPSWDCRACGRPWPCDPAREHLAATLGRTQLAIYAAVNLHEAIGDLPTTPPSKLFDRFLGWTRPGPARQG